MNQRDRRELLLTLEDGVIVDLIPDEDLPDSDESIKKHIELQFPFLKKQKEKIKEFKINNRRKKFLNGLTEEQMNWFSTFLNDEQEEIIEKYNALPFYSLKQLKALSISEEIIKQVQYNFPLLKRHLSEIQMTKLKMNEYRNGFSNISFGILLDRHLETLRAVREKENKIPAGLQEDWIIIQELTRDLQDGKEFDYEQFKLLLGKLIIPLQVEGDPYL